VVRVTTLAVALIGPPLCVVLVLAARRAASSGHARALRASRRWRLPPRPRARLEHALRSADLAVEPEAALELWAAGVAGLGLVAGVLAPGFLVPTIGACVIGAPIALHLARSRHERHFANALPAVLEQVAAELRGGGSVASSVERLAASDSPAARDLGRVHARTRLGLAFGDALAAWPTEHDAPGVRAAAGALAVATSLGGRAADAIDGLASSLRHRLDAAAEARALSTQARLSAVVVGAAPLGYLAFASLVDPRAVTSLLNTGLGRVCLVIGLGLEGLAALWIRRIVRSEA
jgi:tight adherence protein B